MRRLASLLRLVSAFIPDRGARALDTGAVSTEQAVSVGLLWLYRTEQPDEAVLQHHGVTVARSLLAVSDGDRLYRFIPGTARNVIISVLVARPVYVNGFHQVRLRPGEVDQLAGLVRELGHEVAEVWASPSGAFGTVTLQQPAHRSLLAAVDRYRAGCPRHPDRGVFCRCGWYPAGNQLVVLPDVTGKTVGL